MTPHAHEIARLTAALDAGTLLPRDLARIVALLRAAYPQPAPIAAERN